MSNATHNRNDAPAPQPATAPAEHLVAFALEVPPNPIADQFAPPENLVGALLLTLALDGELRRRGVWQEGFTLCAELNRAAGLAHVTDHRAGLAAIKSVLEYASLLPFARIAWLDFSEGIWRTVWPTDRPSPDFWHFLSSARMQREAEALQQKLAAWRAALEAARRQLSPDQPH